MKSAGEKVAAIANVLEGAVSNTKIFVALQELKEISLLLDHGQRSELFHNKLRGFNRMWGDEFSPQASVVSPILDDLFEMHGFPDEKTRAKRPAGQI